MWAWSTCVKVGLRNVGVVYVCKGGAKECGRGLRV